jgi:hypothetical protein
VGSSFDLLRFVSGGSVPASDVGREVNGDLSSVGADTVSSSIPDRSSDVLDALVGQATAHRQSRLTASNHERVDSNHRPAPGLS